MVTFMAGLASVHMQYHERMQHRKRIRHHRYIRKNKTQATTLGFNLKW